MPKVKLDPNYKRDMLQKAIYGRMRQLNVTGADLSEMWGIEPQNANRRLRTMRMDWRALAQLFKHLEFTDAEIIKFMKGEK